MKFEYKVPVPTYEVNIVKNGYGRPLIMINNVGVAVIDEKGNLALPSIHPDTARNLPPCIQLAPSEVQGYFKIKVV